MAPGRRQSMFDVEDDDPLSGLGEDEPHDKTASSSQSRKAQNRQAQREFRLRKQQYVRDLEARVEVLSGDKEERVELMVLLIRNLLKENKELRGMVKSMASFVGEGLGSCLPRLGLSAPQLEAILNRADTDTAYEAFINLKASKELEEANPGIEIGAVRRKERNSSSKRKRSTVDSEGPPTGESSGNPGSTDSHPAPIQTNGETKPNIGELNGLDQYGYLFPDLQAFAQNPPPSAQPGQGMPQFSPIWPLTPGYFNSLFGPGQSPQTASSMGNFMAPSLYPVAGQQGSLPTPGGGVGPTAAEYMSGFGLTLPASQPISSFAGGARADGGDYAAKHPPEPPRATSISRSGSGSKPNTPSQSKKSHAPAPAHPPEIVEEMDRQRRLREAVAKLSEGKSRRESEAEMTPAEVAERASIHAEMQKALKENHMDERAAEAMQLTSYHLSNYRLNHSYVLPPSLKPTPLQRTIPHEYVIDGLPYPSMRDRMILLRGQYDLVSALTDIVLSFSVHGEDVLNHESWEIGEEWIKKYSFLVDDTILAITNKWRATRGERAIILPVVPDTGGGQGAGQAAANPQAWLPKS